MDKLFSTPTTPAPQPAPRPDVVASTSATRPTPPPAHVSFSQVLALARGANAAVTSLPTAPLMATALRSNQGSLMAPMTATSTPMPVASTAAATPVAEGPSASGTAGTSPVSAATGTLGGLTGADGSVEGALAQSQEMNLYFLQLQTQVDAQNRSYTALSNVLKSEHDTVKTAIGNIH